MTRHDLTELASIGRQHLDDWRGRHPRLAAAGYFAGVGLALIAAYWAGTLLGALA